MLSQAAGFSAGAFAVSAGVGMSLTDPRPPRPGGGSGRRIAASMVLRGVALFVLGVLVEPFSSAILVILCTYGVLFVIAAGLRGLSGRALLALGVVLGLLWPPVSLLIRRRIDTPATLEVGWDLFAREDSAVVLARTLFLDGEYPVPTWLALAAVAWGAHRCGWLTHNSARTPPDPPRSDVALNRRAQRHAVPIGGWICGGLLMGGFGGSWLAEQVWHPRATMIADLVAAGYSPSSAQVAADNARGVPATTSWSSLLTAGHHSGTSFELLQILAVSATVYALAAYGWRRVPRVVEALAWPGRIPLTLYVGHLVLLGASGWFWLDLPDPAMAAFLTVLVLWAGVFAVARALRDERGPLESVVRWVSLAGSGRIVHRQR